MKTRVIINVCIQKVINYHLGGWYTSHLRAVCFSGESFHHGIQLSELAESNADVSVKVFVFLVLIIENSFVFLPFLHTADLWILATEKKAVMILQYLYRKDRTIN